MQPPRASSRPRADDSVLRYHYEFRLDNGQTKDYVVELDRKTLALRTVPSGPSPEWTRLDNCRCANCPLQGAAHCPIAVNLAGIVEEFSDFQSFTHADVTVDCPDRRYFKSTSIQQGLSSMFGIFMVTSGCPILDQLRPNVAFHLPFATPSETASRTIGMYLTAQFFRAKRGLHADWSLEGLVTLYTLIGDVNKGLSRRLLTITHADAGVNAIAILHAFGDMLQHGTFDYLNQVEGYYETLLRGK